ncbi:MULTISPECIES: hypothetical protein [unclassified Streptomyces]|uniref:hypothetical protein n=1 Tax=unclassified Streptomyces TaxID=2593676 RepID=UPI000A1DB602|nr:hypothetical protein [Streptomyces sp. 13-12-16]OSP23526.1 hypothetical protein B7767_44045 [Streptomyces sp. 13-12-16]
MKSRSKKLALGAIAAVAVSVALPAAPAFATEEIDCGTGTDSVRVTYLENGTEHARCWTGPGDVPLGQDGVTSFYSGAHDVVVFWRTNLGWDVEVLPPHTLAPFTGADTYHVYGFHVR